MKLKKILGVVLTALGVGALIYAAISYSNGPGDFTDLAVYGILGGIFFFSGFRLIRSINE